MPKFRYSPDCGASGFSPTIAPFAFRISTFGLRVLNFEFLKTVPAILGALQPPRGSRSPEVPMRVARFSLLFSLLFLILSSAHPARPGGQSASSTASAPQLLQQSLAALQGTTPITDVALTGSARRIAGSDDESGSATLKALAGTGARLDLSLSSGPRSELRNTSSAQPAGSWSGPRP